MVTPKRGPIKVDLSGVDGKRKIDAEYSPIMGQFVVRIGKRTYYWTATQFADHFRKWLVRQKRDD